MTRGLRVSGRFQLRPYQLSRRKTPRSRFGNSPGSSLILRSTLRRAWIGGGGERWRNELVPNAAIIVAEQAGELVGFVTIDAIRLSRPARRQARIIGVPNSPTALVDETKPAIARRRYVSWSTPTMPAPSASMSATACVCRGRRQSNLGTPSLANENGDRGIVITSLPGQAAVSPRLNSTTAKLER